MPSISLVRHLAGLHYTVVFRLRRLPRVFRPSANWALVWCEILNPRDVHAKNINKHGIYLHQHVLLAAVHTRTRGLARKA